MKSVILIVLSLNLVFGLLACDKLGGTYGSGDYSIPSQIERDISTVVPYANLVDDNVAVEGDENGLNIDKDAFDYAEKALKETSELAMEDEKEFIIEVNDKELLVKVEDNSSSKALIEKLKEGDISIDAHDYGNFEKVGSLGFELPRNDEQITTKAGDVILYQGTEITIYYDTNSWNFTKLGEITNIEGKELKELLGDGNVTLTLRLKK